MHFSPERGRAERDRASPEWSVASEARREHRERRDANGDRREP
ncbi:hypothetical protein ACFQL3_01560 [Natronoarchaeum sp. GCM10025321]